MSCLLSMIILYFDWQNLSFSEFEKVKNYRSKIKVLSLRVQKPCKNFEVLLAYSSNVFKFACDWVCDRFRYFKFP